MTASTVKLTESVERICWGGISKTRVLMSTLLMCSRKGRTKMRPGPLMVAKERVVPRTTARSYSGIRLRTKKKEKGAVKTTMAKESMWRNVVTTFLRFDSSDHCKYSTQKIIIYPKFSV